MNSARKNELKVKAAGLAASLREELHLTDLIPLDVERLLREKNIQTLFRPMEDSASGMALLAQSADGGIHRFMMVNTNKSLGNQRFTACHEYYHLFFQDVLCPDEQYF